jgi:hypothetical protein
MMMPVRHCLAGIYFNDYRQKTSSEAHPPRIALWTD